jgi:Tfp pilus assembly protein PilW
MPVKRLRICKNRLCSGHTLIELLVAAAVSLLALSAIYLSFSSDRRTFFRQMDALRARQDARTAMNGISQFLRAGTCIYANQAKTVEGQTYHVPAIGASGDDLLFACPEYGSGAPRYTVRGYFLRNRVPPDPDNRDARQLMMYQKTGVAPVTQGDPATIDMTALSGGSTRLVADYLCAGDPVFTIGADGKSVSIVIETSKKTPHELQAQGEKLKTAVKLRN